MKFCGDPTYATDYGTRAQQIVSNIKSRAKRKGLDFDLDWNWFMERYERGVCQASGIPFVEPEYNGKKGNASPWAPSVDRIDNDKGYTKDNCRVVVWIFNVMKGRFTDEDVATFCRGYLIGLANEQKRKKALDEMTEQDQKTGLQ